MNKINIDLTRPRIYQADFDQVRCFSDFIWICPDKKTIKNNDKTIFTIDSKGEYFTELVIDTSQKCIWGITNLQSYKVFKNNSINEFNPSFFNKNID